MMLLYNKLCYKNLVVVGIDSTAHFNTLRPRQNGRHFADGMIKRISFNANHCAWVDILLEFVSAGPIHNKQVLVYIVIHEGYWRIHALIYSVRELNNH